jgi:hypothetical protein
LKGKFNMKGKTYTNYIMPLVQVAFCIVFINGCSNKRAETASKEIPLVKNEMGEVKETVTSNEIAVKEPPFSEGVFPCSECHKDLVPNPKKRELVDMHDSISAIFNHDKENRWCLDCHDMKNRDYLKLASGALLDFKESYKLCGQCHGDKLRDWKVGVHGKRTGDWNGKKEYLLCVNCHNPHAPKFKELTPEPPPIRQEDIR